MKVYKFSSKKDIKKLIRSIFQASVLAFLLYIIIISLFTFQTYKMYDAEATEMGDKGFIAISYFGVERSGNAGLLSTKRLDEHLKALKDSGYVTITQQDVLDYYEKAKELPEKSLFLIFEDGRRDTTIFSQKIMEKYNYIATMLTYADKFEKKDAKFLMPDELLELEETTFWESGTNGYRIEYINVFDRYENYLGEMDSLEFARISEYLDRNYNHYLMDYIRDDYSIPKESYQEMKQRISYDYQKIEDIYSDGIGKVPKVYILMHSNTGQYGTNDRVSEVNEQQIKSLFKMNFNREGYALNTRESSIYDLTRIQPQAHWYTNHLLMRIWDDTKQDVAFVTGDINKARDWKKVEGQAEFVEDEIILTSLPKGKGILRLKESETSSDLSLSVYLQGNQLGSQEIYIRADEGLENYVLVQVKDNVLNVYERLKGSEELLFTLDLDEHDGVMRPSIEEDKKQAKIERLKTEIKYASNINEAKYATEKLQEKVNIKVATVEEGAEAYKPPLELNQKGKRLLNISLEEKKITIAIDKKEAVNNLELSSVSEGYIYVGASWSENGYSQRNLADDVYDGVFKQLVIIDNKSKKAKIIFDNQLKGKEGIVYETKRIGESIINWFINTL